MKNIAQQFSGSGLTNEQGRCRKAKTGTKSLKEISHMFNSALDTTDRAHCPTCDVTNPPRQAVAYTGRPIYKCVLCFKLIQSLYTYN